MKNLISFMLVLSIFVLAKQTSPTTRVYLTSQGIETNEQDQAMKYTDIHSAYEVQIEKGNEWEIVNIE